jgi:hypothetical protein
MPGTLLHVGASCTCPHGGQVTLQTSNARVLVSGTPALTLADLSPVAGCAFMVGNKPQPCVTVRFSVGAARVFINGVPALLNTSVGLCSSAEQIPQGPPLVAATQARVVGS